MEFKHFLKVIWKGWWLILPALLSALTAAWIISHNQIPIYRTSATFVVSPSTTLDSVDYVVKGLDTLTRRDSILATYAAIATSRSVRGQIVKELELTSSQKKHLVISCEQVQPTNIIEIIVESDDPNLAQTVAGLAGEKTIEYVDSLYELYDIKPLDPPYTPLSPTSPDLMQNLFLAGVLGLVVGVALAFLSEYLRASRQVTVGLNIIDAETGAYNQGYLLQRLGAELSRARRHQYPLTLALMHIKNLDLVRDARRPHLKNEVLRQVTLFVTQHLRPEDLVARFDGDSLALLLPDTAGPDALHLLEELRTRIQRNTFELPERGIKLNLSATFGIVAGKTNGAGRDELLVQATEALRRAQDGSHGDIYVLDEPND